MADNLRFYNASRSVPTEAQKSFNNGRFSGTDINPMWRIKKLTELFGPAGLGWYYEVTSERCEAHGEVTMAIVDLNLYIRDPDSGEWSRPIYGTGGNKLLEKGHASDEGYKMALTDALSVACKALGIGADIYYEKDKTKYTEGTKGADSSPAAQNDRRKDDGPAPGRQTTISEPEEQMGTCKHCGKPTPVRILMANRERCRQPFCDMCTEDYIAWKKKRAEGKE